MPNTVHLARRTAIDRTVDPAADGGEASSCTTNWEDRYAYTLNGATTVFNPFGGARFATADAAFSAFRGLTTYFSLASATAVTFSIPDYPNSFGDNLGGVSLNIAAVPEPGTWAMMLVGFGMVTAALRQRRRTAPTKVA